MMQVLESFGLIFRKWIGLLYKAPRAHIKLNGRLLPSFPIRRGTRQGCTLSLALVMEPLAEALRKSSGMSGIRVGSVVKKLALYADDLILFLWDPGPLLSEVLRLLGHSATLSGLQTNWSKSLILPIKPRAKRLSDPASPLQWASTLG